VLTKENPRVSYTHNPNPGPLMNCSEMIPYDFAEGEKITRAKSDESLAFTLKDLNSVIAIQEQSNRDGFQTPKLGYYYDERHTVITEMRKRREAYCKTKRDPEALPFTFELEEGMIILLKKHSVKLARDCHGDTFKIHLEQETGIGSGNKTEALYRIGIKINPRTGLPCA
jgi:hypothetical protein